MNYKNYTNIVLDIIEPRLSQLGIITAAEVKKACKHKLLGETALIYFRQIMQSMIEQGKAQKLKNGTWEIIRPDMSPKKQYYMWDLKNKQNEAGKSINEA